MLWEQNRRMWTSTVWFTLPRLTCCLLPSFLTSSFESWGWQDYLLVCTMIFTGPWFSHKHIDIGGEGSVDGISSKCFSHSLSTFFPNSFDFLNYLMPFGVFFSSLLRFESVSDFTSELEDSDDPAAYVTNLTYYHLVPFETDILDWGCSGVQPASIQPTSSSIGSAISGIASLWIRLCRQDQCREAAARAPQSWFWRCDPLLCVMETSCKEISALLLTTNSLSVKAGQQSLPGDQLNLCYVCGNCHPNAAVRNLCCSSHKSPVLLVVQAEFPF